MLPSHATTTESGKNWLTLALDPFHDFNVPIAGLPDRTNVPTATQFIKKKTTITAPPNLTSGQTWSVHIFSLPLNETINAACSSGATEAIDCRYDAASDEIQIGTINVARMEGDNPTYVQDSFAAWSDTSTAITAYSPTDNNLDSQLRLVAGGFEVHNDTSSLYKNGNVTVYSSPNDFTEPMLALVYDDTSSVNFGCVQKARYPPATVADAALYTDARSWEAAEGCYVPLRLDLDSHGLAFHPRSTSLPVLQDREQGRTSATTGKVVVKPNLQLIVPGTSMGFTGGSSDSGVNGWTRAPIETTGAFFSGLSQETVLTLSIIFVCEVAPTSANPSMLTMCSPSAQYDPRALECYTNCVQKLPPGVPVRMNEKGDFWKSALRVARSVTQIAAPLFGPEGAVLGGVADMAMAAAQRAIEKKQKQQGGKQRPGPNSALHLPDGRTLYGKNVPLSKRRPGANVADFPRGKQSPAGGNNKFRKK